MTSRVLSIRELSVSFRDKRIIDNVTVDLYPGKVTALVGESGSGKTLTALSVLDLLPSSAKRESGSVLFNEKNIFDLPAEEKRRIRGNEIAMVFQEPFTALNPVMKVGEQVKEALLAHTPLKGEGLLKRIDNLFSMVKLPEDAKNSYPHELSGGMRQRVVLAMAMACDPEVLILDEPTTALDVSIQKEILDLIRSIQLEKKFAILFITHDFSIVNMLADEVYVMRKGVVIEKGDKEKVLKRPDDPYTKQLIECIPKLGDKRERLPV